MAMTACRECSREVSTQAWVCPHCGAPRPAQPDWNGWGIDWASPATLFGLPLVHVAVGRDAYGKLRVAKGIVAIGQFAVGVITIAQFGVGLLFFNGRSLLGWLLLFVGASIVFAGILMNMQIYFQPTSLFNTLAMLVLLIGGIGLAIFALIMFVLCFTPVPIQFIGGT